MFFVWWNRVRDVVLLTVLLLASVLVAITQNGAMMRNVRVLSLEVTSRVENHLSWIGHLVRAVDENAVLRRENILLNSQVARLAAARIEIDQLRGALAINNDPYYDIVAARIIYKDIFGQESHLTLDAGRADGVDVDMAVVTSRGILGRVVLVSEHYCRVMPYTNPGFRAPVEILPSFAAGIVSWPAIRPDVLVVEHIVMTAGVEIGDTVWTSSASRIFPPGYPVGTVFSLDTLAGINTLDVLVRPLASLAEARHAAVLLHEYDAELDSLESVAIR